MQDCVQFYGRKFISYNNIHNLIHLASDVQEIGSLDSNSAFSCENKLEPIKNLIRKMANLLFQVIRRLKETEEITIEGYAASLSKEIVIFFILHANGPTHPDF